MKNRIEQDVLLREKDAGKVHVKALSSGAIAAGRLRWGPSLWGRLRLERWR